ncbi:hypothetical protein KJ359_008056 [Pestalotiopsis sp. 9143b]|nr:hypothetical protein KJ359_008056 [Pestalotiopsis sp. 9143b]
MITTALHLLFAVLAAATVKTAATLADLHDIAAGADNLTSTTNAWDGAAASAPAMDASASALVGLVDAANLHASEGGDVASSADSAAVLEYITTTSSPSVAGAVAALLARQADLEGAGAAPAVLDGVQDLKRAVDGFATTLWVVSSEDHRDAVRAAVSQLDTDFAGFIDAFSQDER